MTQASDFSELVERSGAASSLTRAACVVGAAACAFFAVTAAVFTVCLSLDVPDLWARVQAALTSDAYTLGPDSSQIIRPIYSRQITGVAVHTIGGAIAMLAAMTQFAPFIRRRMPKVHRVTGALVVFFVLASMFASLWVLGSHPLSASFSGAVFAIGLASLAGSTLLAVGLAVAAVRARDYRTHMGWMALMFAFLLTAPTLRLEWVVYGWLSKLTMVEANLAIVVCLVPETIIIMAIWMRRVGEPDLGAMPMQSFLPLIMLHAAAMLAIIIALHEGVLAPLGFDGLSAWRGQADHLPLTAIAWGVATALVALRTPEDLMRLGRGEAVRPASAVLGASAGLGALGVAWTHATGDLQSIAQASFFAAWGLEILVLNFLGRGVGATRAAAWDAQWLYVGLAPALWPLLALTLAPLGLGAPITTTAAMMNAYAVAAMLGFASAFGLRIVVGRARLVTAVKASSAVPPRPA